MKTNKLLIIILSVIVLFVGNVSMVEANNKEGKIYKNIYINNIDVSGLTKEQAKEKVEKFISDNSVMIFSLDEQKYKFDINEIGVTYKIKESIDKAYEIGRDENVISNMKTKFNLGFGEVVNINLEQTVYKEKIDNYICFLNEVVKIDPIDATIKIEDGEYICTKDEDGIKIDEKKMEAIILNKINNLVETNVQIPLIEVKAKYIYDDLVKIDSVLGTYETKFNPEIYNRVSNIKVAANATNNIILNKNEEFSFDSYINNESVQSRFKQAPIIINGQLKDGRGGGICQVSSTLYNAALYSGIEITCVTNHSIPSAYISKGRDATISTGSIDFKFKNNLQSPVLIKHKVYGNKIVSTIYGNSNDKKEIKVITEQIETKSYKTKIKNSDKLYKGEKKVFREGKNGYRINTFRVYKDTDKKELINQSYYPPVDKIVIYGTKDKEENEFNTKII